jgi:hypothetical protein
MRMAASHISQWACALLYRCDRVIAVPGKLARDPLQVALWMWVKRSLPWLRRYARSYSTRWATKIRTIVGVKPVPLKRSRERLGRPLCSNAPNPIRFKAAIALMIKE